VGAADGAVELAVATYELIPRDPIPAAMAMTQLLAGQASRR